MRWLVGLVGLVGLAICACGGGKGGTIDAALVDDARDEDAAIDARRDGPGARCDDWGVDGEVSGELDRLFGIAQLPLVARGPGVVMGGHRDSALAVAAYGPSGAPDPAFGTAGVAAFDASALHDILGTIALAPGGAMYAGGFTNANDGTAREALVARFTNSGFDPAFGGGDGVIEIPRSLDTPQVHLASDGVVVGMLPMPGQALFARYTASGAPDTTYGTNGTLLVNLSLHHTASIDDTGSLVMLGAPSDGSELQLVRVTADGELDPTFGTAGVATVTPYNGRYRQVVIAPDGAILVVHWADTPGGGEHELEVVRFTANGVLDQSFGTAGRARGIHRASPNFAFVVEIDGAGRIYIGVDGLLRLAPDGSKDLAFGEGGIVPETFVNGLAILADGRVIAATQVPLNETRHPLVCLKP